MSTSPQRSIWLSGLGLAGLALWGGHYYLHSSDGLVEREQANLRKTAGLREEMDGAREKIAAIAPIEQRAAEIPGELDRWREERRSGPEVVWFPDWLRAQLRRFGIVEAQIRLNTRVPEPGLPGFSRSCWNVNLPKQDGVRNATALLLAVKEIGQRERFVKTLDCSIRANPEEPNRPAGAFNVEVLIAD